MVSLLKRTQKHPISEKRVRGLGLGLCTNEMYYLNKLPVQKNLIRSQIHRLKPLLETEGWSRRLVRQLQNRLESLALERNLLCQSASLPQRHPNSAVSQPAMSRRDP